METTLNAAEVADMRARITTAWEGRPTGGTERERQSWRNGFCSLLDELSEATRVPWFDLLGIRFDDDTGGEL